MDITPSMLVEPIEFGVGEITPERLGLDVTSSPFYEPPQEPEPTNPINVDEESEVSTPFQTESLKDEVIHRASEGFEGGLRYLFNNPKVMGAIAGVGILCYMMGKRSSRRQA